MKTKLFAYRMSFIVASQHLELNLYIIYVFTSLTYCIHIVKKVLSFLWAQSIILDMSYHRMHAQPLQTIRKKNLLLLTGTNSCCS